MNDEKQPLDIAALENEYNILGELATRGDVRAYMATRRSETGKRRDDDSRVLISIVTSPKGDEGNALTHLASDTQQLAHLQHRRLIPVVGGRWLGSDSYAVITQRTTELSLSERIATGETFTTPRIAAVLRDVNALIEWAREHQIVHRNVDPDGVFLEPSTDRVRVSFSIEAIARLRKTDPAEDARTIARLAMAMLTGNEDAQVADAKALGDTREGLPDQLGDATAALLDEKSTGTSGDVAAYLALIGMSDPLAAGESERERIRDEILEEQRVEREKLSAERANFEALMSSERATFEHLIAAERAELAHKKEVEENTFAKEMAEERAAFAKTMADEKAAFAKAMADDRAAFARAMSDDREKHAAEKAELQRAVAAERAALVAKRAELERAVAAQRAEVERVAALDRAQVEKLRAQIKAAGELEVEKKRDAALDNITDDESTLDVSEFNAPGFVSPVLVPLEELAFEDTSLMRDDEDVPDVAAVESVIGDVAAPEVAPVAQVAPKEPRKPWVIPAAIAAGIVVIAVSAIAIRNGPPAPKPVPAQAAAPVKQTAAAPVVATPDTVVASVPAVAAPAVDSAALKRIADSVRTDSLEAAARRRERRRERDAEARRDSIRSAARRDSVARADTSRTP